MTTLSAQTDRFVHDRLPPRDQWPELRYDLPELRIADQANLVERLLDGAAARGWADRRYRFTRTGELAPRWASECKASVS